MGNPLWPMKPPQDLSSYINQKVQGPVGSGMGRAAVLDRRLRPLPPHDPPAQFTLQTPAGDIVINLTTGDVSLPAAMSPAGGAAEFWRALATQRGNVVNQEVFKLAKQMFERRWEEALNTNFPQLMREEIDRAVQKALNEAYEKGAAPLYMINADGNVVTGQHYSRRPADHACGNS